MATAQEVLAEKGQAFQRDYSRDRADSAGNADPQDLKPREIDFSAPFGREMDAAIALECSDHKSETSVPEPDLTNPVITNQICQNGLATEATGELRFKVGTLNIRSIRRTEK